MHKKVFISFKYKINNYNKIYLIRRPPSKVSLSKLWKLLQLYTKNKNLNK